MVDAGEENVCMNGLAHVSVHAQHLVRQAVHADVLLARVHHARLLLHRRDEVRAVPGGHHCEEARTAPGVQNLANATSLFTPEKHKVHHTGKQ
jgi:hypothetical protein